TNSVVMKRKGDAYLSSNGNIVLTTVQLRILNLRVRRPVNLELHTVDDNINVIYAKPFIKK
ncbi:hypothetical protein V6O07_04850, partial [Arthrospira platensis SPKY2]